MLKCFFQISYELPKNFYFNKLSIVFTEHPKVKLFINQAGLQSTDEAISAAIPLIAFPMFGDQSYNAERYEYLKIGKKLDLETLTVEKFTNTIKNVIGDER